MISIAVLAGLAVVWAVVIFPDVFRWVSNNRRGDSIRLFNSQLSSLRHSSPAGHADNVIDLRERMVAPVTPGSAVRASAPAHRAGGVVRPQRPTARAQREPARPGPVSPAVRKRRQDVLVILGAAALLTLLATLAFGPAFLYLHLLADVALAGYLVLLQRKVARSQPVRRSAAPPQPAAQMATLAPLGGPVGRSHTVVPRRIAN